MTIAPEQLRSDPLSPQRVEDGPTDDNQDARPHLRLASVAASGWLASAAAAWIVGGLFRDPVLARVLAIAGVFLGWAVVALSFRTQRPTRLQYAVLPLALIGGAVVLSPAATGGTANLPGLVGEVFRTGGLLQTPAPFDPGWRFILFVFFAVLAAGALTSAMHYRRPKLALLLPLPVAFGGALLLPAGAETATIAVGVVGTIGALAAAQGADLDSDGRSRSGYEARRMVKGAGMLVLLAAATVGLARADVLFPDTDRERVIPPQRPPDMPPEPDRELLRVRSDAPGPWRLGVLDVYDGEAWLLPPIEPSRIVPLDEARGDPVAQEGGVETEFRIVDMRGLSLPVPAGLREIHTTAFVEFDPRIGVPRLDQRIPRGLTYTTVSTAAPPSSVLNQVPPPPEDVRRDFVDQDGMFPPPPAALLPLLQEAPPAVFDRLQFLRDRLYANVVAAGAGTPVDILPTRVAELFSPGAEATPYEITAAEAMLARWAGVPARIGFGYYGGEVVDDGYAVHPRHASMWLEVYFSDVGWVPLVGTPPRAKESDSPELRREDLRVRPSDELALTVYIPEEREGFLMLFELVRYWLLRALPVALSAAAAIATYPGILKAVRAARRRRWASSHGPLARALVPYAEFRDLCHDLNVGSVHDTPLEFVDTFPDDDEHEELAWLITRLMWGDLRRDVKDGDIEAVEELNASLRRRVLAEQTLLNRVLATISRASLREPYSLDVPNFWPRLRGRGRGTSRLGAARLLRVRAPARTTSIMSLLVLSLVASGCSGAGALGSASAPVAYPDRIAPEPPNTLLGYTFVRESEAEETYLEAGPRALVTEGRVFTIHDGDVIEGSLQVALFRPDVDARSPELRREVERAIGGEFVTRRIGTVRMRYREMPEQRLFLWLPPERNVMQLLVTRRSFGDADPLATALVLYQRGLPVDAIGGPVLSPEGHGVASPVRGPEAPALPGADDAPSEGCRGSAPRVDQPGPVVADPDFSVVPPGPVSDRTRIEARLAVRNEGPVQETFRVSFAWGQPESEIAVQEVTVPAGGVRLARAWAETSGRSGSQRVVYRVEGGDGVREGAWPLEILSSAGPSPRLIAAGWMDPLGLSTGVYPRDCPVTEQDVRWMIDGMKQVGMDTVIVTYVEYFGAFFYPSDVRFFDRDVQRQASGQHFGFDVIGTILSQADRNGMHVFLGLGRQGDTHLLGEFNHPEWEQRLGTAVDVAQRVGSELWSRYGHHPSLYGWYLTHETNAIRRGHAYYAPVARHLQRLTPNKPVMIAPPGRPDTDRRTLEESPVDIWAYQDAVGAGYDGERYTYDPERRIRQLDELYSGYRRLHAGTDKHLWSDLEIWEMDGTQGYSGAYPAAFDRVRRQLEIQARHVDWITGYEYVGFMEHPTSRTKLRDPRAVQLYRDYAAYLGRVIR